MANVNKIELTGYKSIRDLKLDLKQINILIGANGSGKSNLLSFFTLLNYITSRNLQQYIAKSGGAEKLLHYGSKRTFNVEGYIEFETGSGRNTYHFNLAKAAGDTLIFTDEQILFTKHGSKKVKPVSLGTGHKETLMTNSADEDMDRISKGTQKTAKTIRNIMDRFRFYQFHDTSDNSNIKNNTYLHDNMYLRSDAGNLAAYLYLIKVKHPLYYRKIISTIQQVAPFFDDFILKPSQLNSDYINLDWMEKGSDQIFNVHQLSDGTLRFIALTTLLLQPTKPYMIIIDEPELGLHPYAINVLSSLIKGVSKKCQIIVSTQSVPFINNFETEDIIVVDRKDDQSTFRRLDPQVLEEWLEEYSLGELWEKNVLGGRPS